MNGPFRALLWVIRRTFNSRSSYDSLRRVYLRTLVWIRRPHDPDFLTFKGMTKQAPLFVDVGANVGQAAISISIVSPSARIFSFEANPRLEPGLEWTRRLLGDRFEYRMCALGAEDTKMKLSVPRIGSLPLETRGSLARNSFDETTQEIEEIEVDVRRFDGLGVDPDVIKIDVEGFEAEVLDGMTATLRRSRPVLLIEKSESFPRCKAILEAMGYAFYVRSPKSGRLIAPEGSDACNFFAIPHGQHLLRQGLFGAD